MLTVLEYTPVDFTAAPVPVPETILCCGHDRLLLYTRRRIMELLGCNVETVMDTADYRAHIVSTRVSIVVLCQTLCTQECEEAETLAAKYQPNARFLVMSHRTSPVRVQRSHFLLSPYKGPRAFAQAISYLLRSTNPPEMMQTRVAGSVVQLH